MNDISSSLDLRGALPSRRAIGVLDPEIAGEGQKIILSDGEQVSWNPPPPQPVMPDWSQVKSLRKYFGRRGTQVYPTWLYHPSAEARLVKNAEDAMALGVFYRKATVDERGRYGLDAVWDWDEGCLWRPKPYHEAKFDPSNPGHGKTYQPATPNPAAAQNQLLEALTDAFTKALGTNGPAKPAKIDQSEWDEFLKFKAFQQAQMAVTAVAEQAGQDAVEDALAGAPSNALQQSEDAAVIEDERTVWLAEAERKGIKVDKRWGLDRLKAEVNKAA